MGDRSGSSPAKRIAPSWKDEKAVISVKKKGSAKSSEEE